MKIENFILFSIISSGFLSSGSSVGDLGEVTPCNASPNMSSLLNIRMPKSDMLENWTSYIQSNMIQTPANTLQFFHQFQKLVSVSVNYSAGYNNIALL